MMKSKLLILCALLVAGSVSLTACGNSRDNGTEAPYEDETNKDVNEGRNGMDGNSNNMYDDNSNGTPGGDLEDAGRNLMDSIKDTGDAIRDGVDNLGDGNNNNNNNNNNTNP